MKLAVLGATGVVGRTMLKVLEERGIDADALVPLASARSAGTSLGWRGRDWIVREPDDDAFRGCGVALFSAGSDRSREWAPRAAAAGAVVVDNSSAWRMAADVPLVVPEINGERVCDRPRGIIANPNCSTIQIALALEALRRAAGLEGVIVTTFQSVSGAGRSGLHALDAERAGASAADGPFGAPIDGNVIPSIGPRGADGWNEEEMKIRNETRKILGRPELGVAATCARVPVRTGHAAALTVRLARPLDAAAARDALAAMPGVSIAGGEEPDPLPIDVAGTDDVRVGRVRVDLDDPRVVHLWVVADNLRKGAATNAVQIAERVIDG
ncbi:MAG: aspartate-semialdehyde dehydrogenase [Gemmatimonadota bacterium]